MAEVITTVAAKWAAVAAQVVQWAVVAAQVVQWAAQWAAAACDISRECLQLDERSTLNLVLIYKAYP
jgi:hypothetical protein